MSDGVPEVRGEALVDGRIIELSDQRFISQETNSRFSRTVLAQDDLVMSVRGTMGKVGLVSGTFVGANITANLLRLSPKSSIVRGTYLSWLLRSYFFQHLLERFSPQTTIKSKRGKMHT